MTELERKEKEYEQYIQEHISFVKLATISYGIKLCELLNISWFEISNLINEHDRSKYSKEEFDGYRQWFYPCSDEEKNRELFDRAWEHHWQNNKHHPEYWGGEDMPPVYIAEMLLDWEAMSIKFNDNTYEYYQKEKDKKGFSANTKKILDEIIYIFK